MRIQRLDLTAPMDIEFTGVFGERPAVYSFVAQPDEQNIFACDVTDPIVIKRLLGLDGFTPLDVEAATGQTVWDVATALEVISEHIGQTVTLEDIIAMAARNAPLTPELQVPDSTPDPDPQPEPILLPVDAIASLADWNRIEPVGGAAAEGAAGGTVAGAQLHDETREARAIAPEVREPQTLAEARSAYKAKFGKAMSPRLTFPQAKEALAKGPSPQE